MASVVYKLVQKELCAPPKWLIDNIQYETLMGSQAYGVATLKSDKDVYGFCIPPKNIIFPHLRGEIPGFGRQHPRFNQYQQHHIIDRETTGGVEQEWDITIYSIVKYFHLLMQNNPNMIDSLYTPQDCVLHITEVGQIVRDNRDMFLHKGAWHKFRGYAYAQLSKLRNKSEKSHRWKGIQEHGIDCKFAYHTVRLVLEIEQILSEGTLDLRRNSEILKEVRKGEWSEEQLKTWFTEKERVLKSLYHKSSLQYAPDEDQIKTLLLQCLEHHYGSLSSVITLPNTAELIIRDLESVIQKYHRI